MRDLTLKLTMLLTLTLAARASEIDFLHIKYLVKYSSGYNFILKITLRHSKKLNLGILLNLIILKKTTISVFANILIYT